MSCDRKRNKGCQGGSISVFLDYGKREGFVENSCLAYSGNNDTPCPSNLDSCTKHFVQDYCVISSEEGIKREILKNGPVVAVIPLYRDFLVYKEGVYRTVEG